MVQLGPWGLQAAQGSLPSTDPPFSPLVPPLSPISLTPEKADTPTQPPPTSPSLKAQESFPLLSQPFIPQEQLLLAVAPGPVHF